MTQTPEQDRDYASEFRQLVEQADAAQSQSYDPMAPADPVPLVEPGLSETAKALEGDGFFDGLAKQNAAEREAEAEKGIFGSFLDAAVGKAKSIFTMDDNSRQYLRDRLLFTPTLGPIAAANQQPGRDGLTEVEKGLGRGFINRMGSQYGGFAQISQSLGADGAAQALDEQSKSIFDVSQSDLLRAKVETLGKIKSEAWFSDTMDYVASKFGEGIGSSVQSLAAGGAANSLPTAMALTYGLGYTGSIGEIRQELQEAGVTDPSQIAKYSYLAAIPHAALDQFTEIGLLTGLSQQAKREITKGIIRTVLKSGTTEGATEAAQRVIEIGAVAHALGGDSPNAAVLAALSADLEKGIDSTILESGVSGFIPGLGFGAMEVAGDRALPKEAPVQEAKAKTGTMTDASLAPAEEATPAIPAGNKTRTIDLDGFTPAQLQNDREVPGPDIQVGPDGQVAPRIVRPYDAPEFDAYEFTDDLISNNKPIPADLPDDDLDEALAFARNEGQTDRRYRALADELQAMREGRDSEAAQPNFIDQIADAVSSPEAAPVIEQVAQVAEQVVEATDWRTSLSDAFGLSEQMAADLATYRQPKTGTDWENARRRIDATIAKSVANLTADAVASLPPQDREHIAQSVVEWGLDNRQMKQFARALGVEPLRESVKAAVRGAAPAAPQPAATDATDTSDSAYKRLVSVLAGKTTRTGWAKATKVSEKTLATLLARAEKDGLVRKDSAGNYRRAKDIKAAVKALRKGAPAATPRAPAAPQARQPSTAAPTEAAAPVSPLPAPTLTIPADMRIEKAIAARERRLRRPLPPYITGYAREIERARGTPEMDAIIDRMKSDEMIRKVEMHEIAALVGRKVTKSATKKAALQTILDRHNDAIAARVGAVLEQEPEANADSTAVLEDAGRVLEEGISQLLQEIGAIEPVGEPSGGDRAGSGVDARGDVFSDAGEGPGGNVGATDVLRGDAAGLEGDGAARPDTGPTEVLTDEQRAEVAAKVAADKEAADQKRRDRETLNYQITDEDKIGQGGPKAKIRANIAAIKVLRTLEDEGRPATEAEKKVLVKYTGWGAFSQDMFEEYKPEFKKERDEFRSLVSKEEYEAARNSTRNAHYTSPDVVNAMWQALEYLGFKGGRAIEPGAGSGNFIGLTPANLREKTDWTAVELDPLTGGIAKNLYQATDVRIQGYQDAKFPDGFFDLAISNVPFSSSTPYDPVYKGKYVLHDFYFLKSLDKVRPGGLVAFITSSGTMDKGNAAARRAIAGKADLVGAIRLPGGSKGAFKSNAGTDVTTDIIFLRKRVEGEPVGDQSWINTEEIETPEGPTKINSYYARNPDMMLGKMRLIGSMYGKGEPVLIGPSENLDQKIIDAVRAGMPENVMTERGTSAVELRKVDTETDGIKDGAYYVKGKDLYRKVAGVGEPQNVPKAQREKIEMFLGLRDIVNEMLAIQGGLQEAKPDRMGKLREALNESYDAFVAAHGPIQKTIVTKQNRKDGKEITIKRFPNLSAFEDDPDAFKVAAVEVYDEKTDTAKKAAIFTQDIVSAYVPPDIQSPADALAVSLSEKGGVDIPLIANRLGLTEAEAIAALGEQVFLDPVGETYRTASEYLAGDVVGKLETARTAAETNPAYQRNVVALEAVQPEPLTRADIRVPFGAPYIPVEVYEQYLTEVLKGQRVKLRYDDVMARWYFVDGYFPPDSQVQFGTSRRKVADLVEAALNSATISITYKDDDGKTIREPEAEAEARAKVDIIKDTFSGDPEQGIEGWIWGDYTRAARIEAAYNNQFNRIVQEKHDGSHLTFPGLARVVTAADGSTFTIDLKPHRVNAIWKVIKQGNTLFNHAVGSGKTWTSIMASMEMKRLGMIQRPMFVVPNHMLNQFTTEFYQAYPNAKLLVATKDQMSAKNRKRFAARIAADTWDGIIITHSSFGKLGLSKQAYQDYYREQIEELEAAMKAAQDAGNENATSDMLRKWKKVNAELGGDPDAEPEGITVKGKKRRLTNKQKEEKKDKAKEKLKKLVAEEDKDDGVVFEETGIDFLFVDEAHLFKALPFQTMHTRIKGIGGSSSKRAVDLFLKMRHLEKSRPGRSAVFMTGTPVSNTMAELYTMQRYLQGPTLKKFGIDKFDAWAGTFGKIVTKSELGSDSRTYKDTESFSEFVNMPELMTIAGSMMDTQTAEMLKLPRPELKGGKLDVVQAELSPDEAQAIDDLIKKMETREKDEPFLPLFTAGIQLATDMRLVDPSAPFNPNGKIAKAVDNIFQIWEEGNADPAAPNKGQLVFLDMGVPGSKGKAKSTAMAADPATAQDDATAALELIRKELAEEAGQVEDGEEVEVDEDQVEAEALLRGKFNLYQDIKDRLIAKGVPADQIAFIHDAKNDDQKAKMFAKMRSGEIRVMLGSTGKMGVGTNVQKLLYAMHHLDAPWRPADLEQRDGRILRQGNQNKEVRIFRYITVKSFDAYRWQLLDRKSQFIGQLYAGAAGVRHMEDITPPLPEAAELKAAATGNPLIIERAELEREVKKLEVAERTHYKTQKSAAQSVKALQDKITSLKAFNVQYEQDAPRVEDLKGDAFKVTLATTGKPTVVDDRKKAGEFVKRYLLGAGQSWYKTTVDLGELSSLQMRAEVKKTINGVEVMPIVEGTATYQPAETFVMGEDADPTQVIQRWVRLVASIPAYASRITAQITDAETTLPKMQEAAQPRPFPQTDKLVEKRKRLETVIADLNKKPVDIASMFPKKGEPVRSEELDPVVWRDLKLAIKKSQGLNSLDGLMEMGAEAHAQLTDAVREIFGRYGVPFKDPGPKGRQRAAEKLGNRPAWNLTDVARAGATVTSVEQADNLVAALAERFPIVDEGWAVTPSGYFDRKIMVILDNGIVGEFQMWPPGMLEAKKVRGGHALYEQERAEGVDPDTKARLQAQQRELYSQVIADMPADLQELAFSKASAAERSAAGYSAESSARETSGASLQAARRIGSGLPSDQPSDPTTAALPAATTAGEPSQSKYLMAGSPSTQNIGDTGENRKASGQDVATSPRAAIEQFAAQVADLKARLSKPEEPAKPTFSREATDVVPEDVMMSIAEYLPPLDEDVQGSRLERLADVLKKYRAEVEEIIAVVEAQKGIDTTNATQDDLSTFIDALDELDTLIFEKMDEGQDVDGEIFEFADALSERMDEIANRYQEIADNADSNLDALSEIADEIDDKLPPQEIIEEDEDIEIEQLIAEVKAAPSILDRLPELSSEGNALDNYRADSTALQEISDDLEAQFQEVFRTDIETLTDEQAVVLRERVDRLANEISTLKYYATTFAEAASKRASEASDAVIRLRDEIIEPMLQSVGNLAREIRGRYNAEVARYEAMDDDGPAEGEAMYSLKPSTGQVQAWFDFTDKLEDLKIPPRVILGEFRVETKPRRGTLTYTVHQGAPRIDEESGYDESQIGKFYLRTDASSEGFAVSVQNMVVDEDYRGRGIATAVFDMIERDIETTGVRFLPPPVETLSEDGKAFWNARDPEALANRERMERDVYFGGDIAARIAVNAPGIVTTPAFDAKHKAFDDAVQKILKRLPAGVTVDRRDQIKIDQGELFGAWEPERRVILLATKYGASKTLETLRHEELHALRSMGLITDAEWSLLTEAARKAGLTVRPSALAGYREIYASSVAKRMLARVGKSDLAKLPWMDLEARMVERLGYDPRNRIESLQKIGLWDDAALKDMLDEEAVARLVSEVAPNRPKGDIVQRVVDRIKNFLGRIQNALRGLGFRTVEDVFQAIDEGTIGKRDPQFDGMGGTFVPEGLMYAIKAFHGSPHSFRKFDMSKIGTGEGAQAYGYGLYFAESEDVARSYKAAGRGAANFADQLRARVRDVKGADKDALYAAYNSLTDGVPAQDVRSKLSGEAARIFDEETKRGRMYEVNIRANPEDVLDWDKPLSQQSEKVRAALPNGVPQDSTGQHFYRMVERMLLESQPKTLADASFFGFSNNRPEIGSQINARLREAGIPGIRYLDGMSRGVGEGSYNYVIFDEDLIEITAIDGQPVEAEEKAEILSAAQQAEQQPGGMFDGVMASMASDNDPTSPLPQSYVDSLNRRIEELGRAPDQMDMTEAGRKARAEAMGFDTSRVLYRGDDNLGRISEFDPKKFGSKRPGHYANGVYLSEIEADAAGYGKVGKFYVRAKKTFVFDDADPKMMSKIRAVFPQADLQFTRGDGLLGHQMAEWTEALKRAGYDSVAVRRKLDDGPALDYRRDKDEEFIVFDPRNIRSVNAAFDPAQSDSANLMFSLAGGALLPDNILASLAKWGNYQPLGIGTNPQYPNNETEAPEKGLSDVVADTVKALDLEGMARQGRLDPAMKRAARKMGGEMMGQTNRTTGVVRLALKNDMATLAHEGGHALEIRASVRDDLNAIKTQFAEDLTVPPAPNAPVPVFPRTGFSGIELDQDSIRLAIESVDAERQMRVLAAELAVLKSRPRSRQEEARFQQIQPMYEQFQNVAGGNRETLIRRFGADRADAVLTDLMPVDRAIAPAYAATRFSKSGQPAPRVVIPPTDVELSEGFAEWFRIYLTNPKQAQALSRGFYDAFEDMLDAAEPEMLTRFQMIQQEVDALAKAAPVSAVRARVQSTVQPGLIESIRLGLSDAADAARIAAETAKRTGDGSTVGSALSAFSAEIWRPLGDRLYSFYHAAFDARHPMKKAVQFLIDKAVENSSMKLGKGERAVVKALHDPYKLWRLAEHSKTHATAALQFGIVHKGQVDPSGPSYWDALTEAFGGSKRGQWNDDMAEMFGSYLIGRRMLAEFARYDRGELENVPDTIISREVWQKSTAQLEKEYPQFKRAAQTMYRFGQELLKYKFENGFLTQEQYDEYRNRVDYTPLNRIMDAGTPSMLGGSSNANKRRLIYRFQGSTRDFINPLETIAQDMFATQQRVEMNRVIAAMDRMARAAGPGGGAIAERIPAKEMRATRIRVADVASLAKPLRGALARTGLDKADRDSLLADAQNEMRDSMRLTAMQSGLSMDDQQMLLDTIDLLFDGEASKTIFKATDISEAGEPIVYLWEGGQRVPIRMGDNEIAKDIFEGFQAFGSNDTNPLVDAAALGTQALRAGITKAPSYVLVNYLRDQLSTWVLSDNFIPFVTGARGLKSVATNDAVGKRYAAFAGLMGGIDAQLIDESANKHDVLTLRRKGFFAVPAKSGIGQAWKTALKAMEITEAGTRFGHFEAAFNRAKADGLSDEEAAFEAAYAAHDVIDFSRRGAKTMQVSRIVAFLNAAFQGLDSTRRAFTGERDAFTGYRDMITPYIKAANGSPLSIAERKGLPMAARTFNKMVVLGMIGLALSMLYKDDEEYEEFNDYMKATHWFFKLGDTWYRFPKPFDLAIFSQIFEGAFDRVVKQDPRAGEKFLQSLKHTMIPPHEINVANLYYEMVTGIDTFRNREIVPMDVSKLPPELQFGAYTSELGRMIGSITGMSPQKVDHFMGGMFGTIGRDIQSVSDAVLPAVNEAVGGALPGVSDRPRAQKSFEDVAIISRFTRRAGRGSLSAETFWKQMKMEGGEYTSAAEGYKMLRNTGRGAEARDLLENVTDDQRAYAILEGEFTEKEQDINPLNRAKQVMSAMSGIRKEMVMGKLYKGGLNPKQAEKKGRDAEEIILPPSKQKIVNEILEDLSMREARNALVAVGLPGWAQKEIMPTDGLMKELEAAAPEVAEELTLRLTKGRNKVYPFEGVRRAWAGAREELLAKGAEADLSEFVADAKFP